MSLNEIDDIKRKITKELLDSVKHYHTLTQMMALDAPIATLGLDEETHDLLETHDIMRLYDLTRLDIESMDYLSALQRSQISARLEQLLSML